MNLSLRRMSMRKAPASGLFTFAMFVAVIVAASMPTNAQTFTTLYNLGTNPGDPIDGGTTPNVVAQGRDGNLYTTSWTGGANSLGTVYKVTPAGVLTVLYSFDGVHGDQPWSGVILGSDGNFYGTTSGGGTASNGTVFKITPGGVLTVLYNFTGGSDGGAPYAPPIQGTDGNLYGTARTGGGGFGTIYKLTLSGTFTVLHQFTGTDGSTPAANLIQATDGNFYGTAGTGGNTCNCGTVFKITSAGKFTVLYNFDDTHGRLPVYASLVQASNGKFYGTAYAGGANGLGVIYQITSAGVVTVVHDFNGTTDGANPLVSLVQATDGNLYSTASGGGTVGHGTLFRINPSGGNFSVQYNYGAEGSPASPLLQNTNGVFYGKTVNGGTAGDGVFYSFNEGLGPFVTFLPRQSLGKIGASIGILGQGFTGTTAVSFNGTAATFTVASPTYLTATVPTGATTGSITVTTPSGKLKSSQKFRVTPVILSFNPTSGPVGTSVVITGTSLLQTTKVTFGGVGATTLTVNSDTQVTAIVPAGAKTGKIAITTPGGTAQSATSFTVTP
jgi:uncharacterized repeat protein (TIGR03803 family)